MSASAWEIKCNTFHSKIAIIIKSKPISLCQNEIGYMFSNSLCLAAKSTTNDVIPIPTKYVKYFCQIIFSNFAFCHIISNFKFKCILQIQHMWNLIIVNIMPKYHLIHTTKINSLLYWLYTNIYSMYAYVHKEKPFNLMFQLWIYGLQDTCSEWVRPPDPHPSHASPNPE